MIPRVCKVEYLKDYQLEVSFTDDTVAKLDFRQRVVGRGGVFKPMENLNFFKQVKVDSEAGTLVWPNGVDFCPDALYCEATGKSTSELGMSLEVV